MNTNQRIKQIADRARQAAPEDKRVVIKVYWRDELTGEQDLQDVIYLNWPEEGMQELYADLSDEELRRILDE